MRIRTTLLGCLMLLLLSGCGTTLMPRASVIDAVSSMESHGDWSFSLAGERGARKEFPLSLTRTGLLHATLEWDAGGADSQVALIVFREGTPGAYARSDGAPPNLDLYWTVPARLLEKTSADEWSIAVVNLRDMPISGSVQARLEPVPAP